MSYIPERLRHITGERADYRCEYCLYPQLGDFLEHEIDHPIARKHGGETIEGNLCLACFDCNRHKGSDIASLDPLDKKLTALFNPRTDKWTDHFHLDGAIIQPLTPQGRVTVFLLHLNDEERILQRAALIRLGRYPKPIE